MKALSDFERVCAGLVSLVLLAGVVCLAWTVCGCIYKGAKVTEGTDLAIGLTVPGTEGMVQLNALNYLSGFRLGVAENSALTMEYTTVASNTYFGIVETQTSKRIKAKVEPCEAALQTEKAVEAEAAKE